MGFESASHFLSRKDMDWNIMEFRCKCLVIKNEYPETQLAREAN